MKFYFVYMQNPNNELFYNIGDFGTFDEAVYYASTCDYVTKIKEVGEGYSSVIMEGELFGQYDKIKNWYWDMSQSTKG